MPKPRPGEDRARFITRCVSDAESIADFPNTQQRVAFCYSQYERYSKPAISKQFKQVWQTSVERQRGIMERQYIAKLRKWYNAEYAKGVQQFVDEGRIIVQGLFPITFLSFFYEEYYEETGLHFANWYFKNYKKFTKKQSADQYQNQWRASFASYGAAVAKTNVTLVQGTALKTLIQLTTKLSRDPEWQALGTEEQARILRRQFDGYSKYQAERFIKTETTAISNKAILESATTIFPADQLYKEWSTALDNRERASHKAADALDPVPYDQPFIVQGEELMHPGDRSIGVSASNVINCRCAAIPVPIEDAVAVEGLENIGVQMAGENLTGGLTAADVASIAATVGAPKPKPKPRYSGPDQGKGEPLGDYFERVNHPALDQYNQLKKLEAQGYIVGDLEILKEVKQSVPITTNVGKPTAISYSYRRAGGAFDIQINNINIDPKLYPKNSRRFTEALVHEIGHQLHYQRNWLGRKGVGNATVNRIFKKYQREVGFSPNYDTAKLDRIEGILYTMRMERAEIMKKYNLTEEEFMQYRGSVADFFGCLTKEAVGFGHGRDYYTSPAKMRAEFIAHLAENFYHGNPVFKHYFPKAYEDTKKMWLELLKS